MVKVTMNLTENDVRNVDRIEKLVGARSKAHAISIALALTKYIVETIVNNPGTQLLIKDPSGRIDRIVLPEIENANVENRDIRKQA